MARLAGVLAACWLAVCAAGVALGQGSTAPQHAIPTHKTSEKHVEHPATAASPEVEFEEALALRRKLNERDLRSALHLLADSARQFASSGQLRQAAVRNSKPEMCIS